MGREGLAALPERHAFFERSLAGFEAGNDRDEFVESAKLLHIKPTTLNEMIKRYDIRPRRKKAGAPDGDDRLEPATSDVD